MNIKRQKASTYAIHQISPQGLRHVKPMKDRNDEKNQGKRKKANKIISWDK